MSECLWVETRLHGMGVGVSRTCPGCQCRCTFVASLDGLCREGEPSLRERKGKGQVEVESSGGDEDGRVVKVERGQARVGWQ